MRLLRRGSDRKERRAFLLQTVPFEVWTVGFKRSAPHEKNGAPFWALKGSENTRKGGLLLSLPRLPLPLSNPLYPPPPSSPKALESSETTREWCTVLRHRKAEKTQGKAVISDDDKCSLTFGGAAEHTPLLEEDGTGVGITLAHQVLLLRQ